MVGDARLDWFQNKGFLLNDFKGVAHDYFEEISKGHGRIETRKSWISNCLETIGKTEKWSGITAIGMVESERCIKGVTTIERRHYIASIA
jgi:hypothetical protein